MLRISTSMMFDLGVASMQQQSAALAKIQQEVASGRKILTPQDDPVGATRVLEVSQAKALNAQYDVNADAAKSALELEDTILGSLTELYQNVRTTAQSAINTNITNSMLSGMATALRNVYNDLLGLANSRDGNGQYMFAGYRGATLPFSETAPGVVAYNGDQGARLMQISSSRQIAVSDAGSEIFMRIQNGGGANESVFTTLDTLINAITAADVTNPVSRATLMTNLDTAMAQMDRVLTKTLQVRASVGTRLQEVDAIKTAGQDVALQYDKTLSNLQDLDYARGVTDLMRYQTGLEAAQKSFAQVQGLSLFNYL